MPLEEKETVQELDDPSSTPSTKPRKSADSTKQESVRKSDSSKKDQITPEQAPEIKYETRRSDEIKSKTDDEKRKSLVEKKKAPGLVKKEADKLAELARKEEEKKHEEEKRKQHRKENSSGDGVGFLFRQNSGLKDLASPATSQKQQAVQKLLSLGDSQKLMIEEMKKKTRSSVSQDIRTRRSPSNEGLPSSGSSGRLSISPSASQEALPTSSSRLSISPPQSPTTLTPSKVLPPMPALTDSPSQNSRSLEEPTPTEKVEKKTPPIEKKIEDPKKRAQTEAIKAKQKIEEQKKEEEARRKQQEELQKKLQKRRQANQDIEETTPTTPTPTTPTTTSESISSPSFVKSSSRISQIGSSLFLTRSTSMDEKEEFNRRQSEMGSNKISALKEKLEKDLIHKKSPSSATLPSPGKLSILDSGNRKTKGTFHQLEEDPLSSSLSRSRTTSRGSVADMVTAFETTGFTSESNLAKPTEEGPQIVYHTPKTENEQGDFDKLGKNGKKLDSKSIEMHSLIPSGGTTNKNTNVNKTDVSPSSSQLPKGQPESCCSGCAIL